MIRKEINSKPQKRKREEVKIEDEGPRLERVSVWTPIHHRAPESSLDFNWPEFTHDRERIKATTLKFKDSSIVEAFGIQTEERVNKKANLTPREYYKGRSCI